MWFRVLHSENQIFFVSNLLDFRSDRSIAFSSTQWVVHTQTTLKRQTDERFMNAMRKVLSLSLFAKHPVALEYADDCGRQTPKRLFSSFQVKKVSTDYFICTP